MSNVPLPEPDFVQVHKPAFYKDIPIRLDWWSATSMHAHGAAVSAAKDAEIERLRAEVAGLREDADRYRWIRDNPWPPILEVDIVLHRNARWDAAIDAARKGEA